MVKNTFYGHFEGFWSPSYLMSKLTSVCVNLIMSIYFLYPCAHLDLVYIGQNMSATLRLTSTLNPMKKFSNCSMLRPWNPKILENVPRFHPSKIFFILTLHIHRQSFDWPLISILTSQPIHEVCSGPWKTSHMFSIYEKTVNRKTSWKVSFGSYRCPLQIPIDIGPMSSTLCAINGWFVFWPEKGHLLKWP